MDYSELTRQVKALEKEKSQIERSIEAKLRRRDRKILDLNELNELNELWQT